VSGNPEELLRSALEKIVFFECKLSSLESELDAARTAAARAREEAGSARRRETELEQTLAQLRGEHASNARQGTELLERVRLLEAERERFLSGMVEQARVAGAPADDDDEASSSHDLAGFIAELRGEIEQLRTWKRAAEAAGLQPEGLPAAAALRPPSEAAAPVPALATRFEEAGRIGLPREARALPSFSTRSERVLYEASLDDLGAADPGVRRRAADGLRALGSKSAAPLVAAALGREGDPDVKVALLTALGALAEPGAADLALRELSDSRPMVRAAALEAATALSRDTAATHLSAALADASALVRRRAVMLLGFTPGETAEEALAAALGDRDAGVARSAAVALAGRPSARAQGALARALDHREPEVRRAAARAVGRWSGEAVDASAPEPERRRTARRITEKLMTLDGADLRTAMAQTSARFPAPAPAPRPSPPAAEKVSPKVKAAPQVEAAPRATPSPAPGKGVGPSTPLRSAQGERRGEGQPAKAAQLLRGAATAVAVGNPDPSLLSDALAEVRMALRGRTVDEVAMALARDRVAVETSLRALVTQGQLVARGPRFFMS
jgi:hypothetical protein